VKKTLSVQFASVTNQRDNVLLAWMTCAYTVLNGRWAHFSFVFYLFVCLIVAFFYHVTLHSCTKHRSWTRELHCHVTHRACISTVGHQSVAPHTASVLLMPPLTSPNRNPANVSKLNVIINQWINESTINESTMNQWINESINNQWINESTINQQSMNQWINNQSTINESMNQQSMNQWMNESINQSIDQSMIFLSGLSNWSHYKVHYITIEKIAVAK